MHDSQYIELQTRLGFQERHLDELNQVIYEQERRLMKLEAMTGKLQYKLNALLDSSSLTDSEQHEKPPHY